MQSYSTVRFWIDFGNASNSEHRWSLRTRSWVRCLIESGSVFKWESSQLDSYWRCVRWPMPLGSDCTFDMNLRDEEWRLFRHAHAQDWSLLCFPPLLMSPSSSLTFHKSINRHPIVIHVVAMFDIVTLMMRHSESEHAEHYYWHFLEAHLLKGIHPPPPVPSVH